MSNIFFVNKHTTAWICIQGRSKEYTIDASANVRCKRNERVKRAHNSLYSYGSI